VLQVDDSEEDDSGECELIPAEDQLDLDDPDICIQSMCAERIARIRQYWEQQLRSVHVKQEVEAAAAQQVLGAYDDLYEEEDRGADDSEVSEGGHEEWCEETDWNREKEERDEADDTDESAANSVEEEWQEADGDVEKIEGYGRWKSAGEKDEEEHDQQEHKYEDESMKLPSDVHLGSAVSDQGESAIGGKQRDGRRRALSSGQRRSRQRQQTRDPSPHRQRHAQTQPLVSSDISDILSEGPTAGSDMCRQGFVWRVHEDGSEGLTYDRDGEEEWIHQEVAGGRDSGDITSQSQPTKADEQADGQHTAAVMDDCVVEMEEQEEADHESAENEEQEQDEDEQDDPTQRQSRRAQRKRVRHSRQHRAKRRRSPDRVEQRRTVRRKTSVVRKTRTTTTETTVYWRGGKADADSDSDSSTADSKQSRSRRKRATGRKKSRQAKPTTDFEGEAEEMETESADERNIGSAMSDNEVDEEQQCLAVAVQEPSRIDSCVCIECGEPIPDDHEGVFCSPSCELWVGHKAFLSDMHRTMCPSWQQQHDQYYQPMHNLPLYPLTTTDLAMCQLPFALLATESLHRSSPIAAAYLEYQLTLHPAVRLAPSPIHGLGVFVTQPLPLNTRLLTIFGLLYPRDHLLDDTSRLLPAARGMDRLLDVDALSVDDVTVVMSISRACVAGYVNSAVGTGRRANVRFKCDERVGVGRWREEGWVPSGLMVVTTARAVKAGEELLEKYPV